MFYKERPQEKQNTSIKVHIHKPAGNIIENLMYYTQKKGTKQSLGQYPKVKNISVPYYGTYINTLKVHTRTLKVHIST